MTGKRAMGDGAHNEPLVSPRNFLPQTESGVWPNFSRNCLEGPFFRHRALPVR